MSLSLKGLIDKSSAQKKKKKKVFPVRICATVLSERCEMSLVAQAQGDRVHLTGGPKAR